MRFILFFLFIISSCFANEERPVVLVSFAPYRYLVHQIAGDLFQVELMVPPGASAHTYEPTPKQMIQASKADIWFRIGEPFETRAIRSLKSVHPDMKIVDLRQGLSLLNDQCHACCHEGHMGQDLHVWLSPKLDALQAKTIFTTLSSSYPAHKALFEKNFTNLLQNLDSLNEFIRNTLAPVKNRILLVSHPAYAYFCQEYQFSQIPLEFEGKDPTAKQLNTLLEKIRNLSIPFIFTQPQYSDKAAKLIAAQIHARVISVDPYAEDIDAALRKIASIIAENS